MRIENYDTITVPKASDSLKEFSIANIRIKIVSLQHFKKIFKKNVRKNHIYHD